MSDPKSDTLKIIAESVDEVSCDHCGEKIDVRDRPMFSSLACPSCGREVVVPGRLGGFRLVEVIGQGGMATVYKALDQSLGRLVAVKLMRREYGEDPNFVNKFLHEAQAAAKLNHPNVVQVYSCGQEKGQPYIIMELVDGEKFEELIASGEPMEEKRALRTLLDVVHGLEAADEIGLVHGDIKPANILFDRHGTAKVADFGLAQFAHKSMAPSEVWGTPYYIAPEKARKEREDQRSDIYCLGATMFHALAGHPPFDGETATDVVLARLRAPAPDLREANPNVSRRTREMIGRMLEADAYLRYPNYKSLESDVRLALDEPQTVERRVPPPVAAAGRKRRVVLITLSAAAAALAVVAGWMWMAGSDGGPPPEEPLSPGAEDGNLANGEAAAPGTTGAVETVESTATPRDPFTDKQDGPLTSVLSRQIGEGNYRVAEDWFAAFLAGLPADAPQRPWLELFHATSAHLDGRRTDREEHWKRLEALIPPAPEGGAGAAAPADAPAEESPPPTETADPKAGEAEPMAAASTNSEPTDPAPPEDRARAEAAEWTADRLPRRFAALMRGQEVEARPEMTTNLPAWSADLELFYRGLDRLGRAEEAAAVDAFTQYVEAVADRGPAWPYGLQPSARDILDRIGKWRDLRESIGQDLEAGEFAVARNKLNRVRTAIFSALKQAESKRIADAQRAVEEERRRAERAAKEARKQAEQAKAAEEIEALRAFRERQRAALRRYDFAGILREVNALHAASDTSAGRAAIMATRDEVERARALIDFLVESINAMPYTEGQAAFGGVPTQASSRTIVITLGGGIGTAEKDWTQVSPRQVFDMTRFYLARRGLDEAARADTLLSLAAYFDLAGGEKPARTALEQALALNPDLEQVARRLMPELVP